MNFVLKERSFFTHIILFFITGGLWLFIFFTFYILDYVKKKNKQKELQKYVNEKQKLFEENEHLNLEIKKQKLTELKLKNAKNMIDIYNKTK